MAFPVVETTATYESEAASSHDVPLPASIASGDLLLMFFTIPAADITSGPSGWTGMAGNVARASTFYREADGTEGASATVTLSGGVRAAAITYRISGADSNPESTISAVETSNPPEVTASWGIADNLYFVHLGTQAGDQSVTAPTGYGSTLTAGQTSSATSRCRLWVARRELSAASDDPATWTLNSGTLYPYAATVVVQPAVISTYIISGTVTNNATAVQGAEVAVLTDDEAGTVTLQEVVTTDVSGNWDAEILSGLTAHTMAWWDDAGTLYTAEARPLLTEDP